MPLKIYPLLFASLATLTSCSPLKSSPHDEKHQWELTVHEVQTTLDDLRHDINCFQTEIQILDGRIKYYENALATLKKEGLEQQQAKIELLSQQIQSFEKKWAFLEKNQNASSQSAQQFLSHANETTASLSQFKDRIQELEQEILLQNRKFDELAKLKGAIESIAKGSRGVATFSKIYKVRSGDSLEKIAKAHKTSVEKIKKLNSLDNDLIVIGQEI